MLGATFSGQDPRANRERWLVPHVLSMPAGQVCDPVALLILMVADDGLVHAACLGRGPYMIDDKGARLGLE